MINNPNNFQMLNNQFPGPNYEPVFFNIFNDGTPQAIAAVTAIALLLFIAKWMVETTELEDLEHTLTIQGNDPFWDSMHITLGWFANSVDAFKNNYRPLTPTQAYQVDLTNENIIEMHSGFSELKAQLEVACGYLRDNVNNFDRWLPNMISTEQLERVHSDINKLDEIITAVNSWITNVEMFTQANDNVSIMISSFVL